MSASSEKPTDNHSPEPPSSAKEIEDVACTVHSDDAENLPELTTEDYRARRKKVLRKIDIRLLPAALSIFTLSILDRGNVGNAKILNADTGDSLQQTTKISDLQYTNTLVIFYVAYTLFGIPSIYMLKKNTPSRWFAFIAFSWGIMTMVQSAVHSYGGLLGIRFVQGMFEAGIFPGIVYFLTFWYRPEERAHRIAFITACATLGGAFGGAIAYGVGFMNEDRGVQAWRWLSIIEGGLTCLIAICVWFILPDFPETATFLTTEEREVAICRSRDDAPHGLERISWAETKATLKDWRLYLHYIAFFSTSSPFASFSLFTPTLVSGLGFKGLSAQLFTVPPFACAFVFVLTVSWVGDCFKNWSFLAMICLAAAGICFAIEGSLSETALTARYVVLCITACFSYGSNPLLLNYMTANIRGTSSMTLGVPLNMVFATLGNICGLYIYKSKEAIRYPTGNYSDTAMMLVSSVIICYLRYMYAKRNRNLPPGAKKWVI